MKKDKIFMIITISIMAFILACVMFAQFRIVEETDLAQIENMREEELRQAIAEWKEKYEKTIEKILDTNKKVQEYEEKQESNKETKELVQKELSEAKEIFGLTNVEGDGIIITLTDTEEMAYTGNDLLYLVNELRAAGAEAISINDERIINMTDIADISSKYIVVNSNPVLSPYIVKVIGDKTYLKSALTIKNGYVDLKEKEGYKISLQEKNNIKINKYSGDVTLKYIQQ